MGTQILCIPHKAAIPHPVVVQPLTLACGIQTDHQGFVSGVVGLSDTSNAPIAIKLPNYNHSQPETWEDMGLLICGMLQPHL